MLQYQLKMEDAPILRLLDSIITEGLVSGTSDIHLEPGTEYDRIRYRIDGVLQQVQRLPMERHTALVSCVKLMAGMDIAEKRKPQDGRAQVGSACFFSPYRAGRKDCYTCTGFRHEPAAAGRYGLYDE